jgi:hypothetical protein
MKKVPMDTNLVPRRKLYEASSEPVDPTYPDGQVARIATFDTVQKRSHGTGLHQSLNWIRYYRGLVLP